MKLRLEAGSSAHYYKFTRVTEIQCWTLYGQSPGFPEMEIVNDELRNEGLVPRAQCSDRETNVQGTLNLRGSLAGCSSWS